MSDYGIMHQGKVYTPNSGLVELTEAVNKARNEAIEAEELLHWEKKPQNFGAYTSNAPHLSDSWHGAVTTWLGTKLGYVYESHTVQSWNKCMRYIRVRGDNGACYYGAYNEERGNFVMLRKLKHG